VSTFVSVGNAKQPFQRLLNVVTRLADVLPQPVLVQHGHTPFIPSRCKAVAFLGMEEFEASIREAELIILHAGAGSVIHALQAGKVPVIVPRLADYGEHVNNHQLELARVLEGQGRVIVTLDPDELLTGVSEALNRQRHPLEERAAVAGDEPRMVGLVRQALAEFSALR
jgi:UDP-N-acetylglucosamine transferase subunit ALG13